MRKTSYVCMKKHPFKIRLNGGRKQNSLVIANYVTSSEKLLHSSSSSEKIAMLITTHTSKQHILRFTIAANEKKMPALCILFKLIKKQSALPGEIHQI